MKFAMAVPTKGSGGRFAVDKALGLIEEVGGMIERMIVKNDQDSIQYFIKDLVEQRQEGRTVLEDPPVESSGSNGLVE